MTLQHVAQVADIPDRGSLIVSVDGTEIGLFRIQGDVVAWRNFCPHMAAPVCKGVVDATRLPSDVYQYRVGREGEILQCPWHGWEFDLVSGQHLAEGSRARLRRYPVEVRGDDVFIRTRD